MMLTAAAVAEFDPGDRDRGNHVEMLTKVHISEVGTMGVRAQVDGSYGQSYLVAFDFRDARSGQMGVHCDCPRFHDGYCCKHIWATMLRFDLSYDKSVTSKPFSNLRVIDPDDVLIGDPLTSTLRKSKPQSRQGSRRIATNGKPKSSPPKPPSWRDQLENISRVRLIKPIDVGYDLPDEVLPDAAHAAQLWFVLSVSDPVNSRAMRLISMRSTPNQNGLWGRPVAAELPTDELTALANLDERHAFALLNCDYENRYPPTYRHYRQATRLHRVDPPLLTESIVAMHRTGRLAWKLGDSKQHFEDARPVDAISVEQSATLRLTVSPDPERPTELKVSPRLSVPEFGDTAIDRLLWISEIGCALLQLDQDPERSLDRPRPDLQYTDPTPADDASIRTCLVRLGEADCHLVLAWQRTPVLRVPASNLDQLLGELSQTHGDVELSIDSSLSVSQQCDEPRARCLLQQEARGGDDYSVAMTAVYPDRELAFGAPVRWWFDQESNQIRLRNWDAERKWLATIEATEYSYSASLEESGATKRQIRFTPERFLSNVQSLQDGGWEVIANGAPLRLASDFDIRVTSDTDWFDLNAEVKFDGVSASLPELLDAYQSGANTIVLDDGTVGMLPQDWLSKFGGIQDSAETVDGTLRFHRTQGLLLDVLLEEHADVGRDRDFATFLRQIKSFDGIKPKAPPKSFSGQLRDYQETALGWFRFLQKFGFGGCLADDMGLGKTIQVLALLEARRKRRIPQGESRKPSIIVVPKSLIFNWLDEAERFTPKLRIRNHTGIGRKVDWDQFSGEAGSVDVLLTTYGTMRIDAPLLAPLQFDYAVLDEAQAIKNPKSLVARAARLIQAEHRLALTGTPVENHLGDLWSLFDFLNPGMLGSAKSSARLLPNMQDEQQRQQVQKISRSLRPFILRRTKSEVLTELPDKVEQTLVCSMDKKQQKLYNELREHYRVHLSDKVKQLGLKRSKIHVLEALLRLRQAACDPRLLKPDCGVRGAKIEELVQRLEELHGEGRKALVFSQFTSLLRLLKEDLDQRGWNYEYLDGKTRKRKQHVERFQTDPRCQLFLISLKAGGHGLNLTAAEYVFILDPWWNPAVEAQAIDRAHRMGQTRSINAYRMICGGSVEEKIIQLQASKRDLADAIIDQNNSLIGQLTAEELESLLG